MKQGQIGFHAVGVRPEDADHLVADFGSVDGSEDGRPLQTIGTNAAAPVQPDRAKRASRRPFRASSPAAAAAAAAWNSVG